MFGWQLRPGLHAGVGAFDPRSLFRNGDQGFWYDPSDLSTLFQDVAGTIPVTGVGQPVALMIDKSGRGHHQSISVPAYRPILRQNATTGAYYLETDGADDYMVSAPVDFTGSDKVSLFTGVRATSPVSTQVIIELSASTATNSGSFVLFKGLSTGAAGPAFTFRSNGTTAASVQSQPAYEVPVSVVISAYGCISDPLVTIRANGGATAQNTAAQGSGNYGNYPLYMFRRGGTTLPWAGHFYGLVGVGRLTTAAETVDAERWLARRVGVTLA